MLDVDVEGQGMRFAVGDDFFRGNQVAGYDDVDGDLAALADSVAFDVPVGFLVEADSLGFGSWRFRDKDCHVKGDLHLAWRVEVDLVEDSAMAFGAQFDVVNFQIKEMTADISAIAATIFDAEDPAVEVEPFVLVQLHIDPAKPDFVTVDAGEVGHAANDRAVAAEACGAIGREYDHLAQISCRWSDASQVSSLSASIGFLHIQTGNLKHLLRDETPMGRSGLHR